MPFPNEHAARLQDPKKFDRFRRVAGGKIFGGKLEIPKTIGIIWGHIKDAPPSAWAVQTLRFPTKDWSVKDAEKWLKDNKIKPMLFEPAEKKPVKKVLGLHKSIHSLWDKPDEDLAFIGVVRQEIQSAHEAIVAEMQEAGLEHGSILIGDIRKEESYKPPQSVQNAAQLGLDLREEFKRGGTAVGVARARDLSNAKNISLDTIKRMVSYFARHAVDAEAKGDKSRGFWEDKKNPSAGWIAWLLWGGDPGKKWAESIYSRVEKQDPFSFGPAEVSEHIYNRSIDAFQPIATDEGPELNAKILKADTDERIVCGIVLEPNTVDAQDDIVSEDEVRKAAHYWIANSQKIGYQHSNFKKKFKLLESYIAPSELIINGQTVKKGSWVLVVKVIDDKTWKEVKSGEITGFSIGGTGTRSEAKT